MINSTINKKAWTIRKFAAKSHGCKVKQIPWRECLKHAILNDMQTLNKIVNKISAFDSVADLIYNTKKYGFRPKVDIKKGFLYEIFADCFDQTCKEMGINKIANRY